MTVVLYCSDEMILEQIKKQLAKLVDVRDIKELKPDESVRRELMLVKIRVNENERRNVIAISDVFRGRIVDVGQESLIVELTGNQSKLEGFLNLVQGYEILELARTGVTGLSRGVHDVRYLD
jgi:acetolactate synthase-1/3 small subunit